MELSKKVKIALDETRTRSLERTPSLFVGEGTSLSAVAKNGSVSARGIA